ncbi:MAG: septum formation inhibitor Maf [Micromonosporaceae bacterium]|nr:septum formation inhibitor Maf [Micromonosporaceae bacterium]
MTVATSRPRPPRLILASASPARLKTLRSAGIDAEVVVSGVDESTITSEDPGTLSEALARLKAQAVASALAGRDGEGSSGEVAETVVLGCDSVLAFGGEILGKPADAAEAAERWRRMRGASGVLHTGHCLISVTTGKLAEAIASTVVHFADVTEDEIAAYVATGEPLRVAGAFTIDGLGGPFVERIDGDAGTVIGLSLPLLRRLLRSLGLEFTDFWNAGIPPAG